MTLIRYCWESTCEQGNDFISRHVMAGCNHRFISFHDREVGFTDRWFATMS